MSQPNEAPEWLKGDDVKTPPPAAAQKSPAPVAKKRKVATTSNDTRPGRSLKGFRIREDYQQRFDVLAATMKHMEGKKGPDLMEEALEMLFRKYDKKLAR